MKNFKKTIFLFLALIPIYSNADQIIIKYKYSHEGASPRVSESLVKEAIERASTNWERYCNIKFIESAVDENNNGVIFWSQDMNPSHAATATLGNINGPANNFQLKLNTNNNVGLVSGGRGSTLTQLEQLTWVITHEFGHVIGLNHNVYKDSVMNILNNHLFRNSERDKNLCIQQVSYWHNK